MGYGRVLDEILQNIPNKRVSRKMFFAKGLGDILLQSRVIFPQNIPA
jgi:hypothetical protein